MKKLIQTVLVFLLTLSLVSLCGCSSVDGLLSCAGVSEHPKVHACILLGMRANNYVPSLNGASVSGIIDEAVDTSGSLSIISVEGTPAVAADLTIPEPEFMTDPSTVKTQRGLIKDSIRQTLLSVTPTTPEADLMAAITLGSRSLSAKRASDGDDAQYILLIVDNGLSTSGAVDFRRQLLQAEPDALVSSLKDAAEIPDLVGVDVIFVTCGDTAGDEQMPLSNREKVILKDIWTKILTASGAKSVTFSPDLPSGIEVDKSFPDVSEVKLISTSCDPPESILSRPVIPDPDRIRFNINSAEFTYGVEKVREVLKPYADVLIESHAKLLRTR